MISVNATYNTILSNGGQFEWQIKNGSNTWTKANIISGTIASTLFDRVSIGNTISSQLDIQLRSVTVDTSSSLIVQFRATDGTNNSPWYTKGTFFIDTLDTSIYSEITKIRAFDSMLMSEYVYQLSGDWTAETDLIILNRITGVMGTALEAATQTLFSNNPKTLTASPNIGEDGTTAREMLSYIGALRGGNWIITNDNKLKLIVLSTSPSDTANIGDAVVDFDASPVETVTKVRVWISDDTFYAFPELTLTDHSLNPITTHTPENITIEAISYIEEWEAISGRCIDVQIPFYGTYSRSKALYNQFKNKSYQPFKTGTAFIPPQYEVGDGITVKNITSIIASQSINISPLASSSAELKKEEIINSLYPYKNPYKRKTNYQVNANTAQIAKNTAQIAQNATKIENVPTLIQQQTELISGGYGGYIKFNKLPDGTPSEMLIMDTPDESTATDIIRLNMNGIGFSTDGGATYGNAWTIDGKLNADYLQVGTIADAAGKNSWNLTTGALSTTSLEATDYVYLNGGAGSYLNIPLSSSDPTNQFFRIQAASPVFLVQVESTWSPGIYAYVKIDPNIIQISDGGDAVTTIRSTGMTATNTVLNNSSASLSPTKLRLASNAGATELTSSGITTSGDVSVGGSLTVNSHSVLEIH